MALKRSELFTKTADKQRQLFTEQVDTLVEEIKSLSEDLTVGVNGKRPPSTPEEKLKIAEDRLGDIIDAAIGQARRTRNEIEELNNKIRSAQQEERYGHRGDRS